MVEVKKQSKEIAMTSGSLDAGAKSGYAWHKISEANKVRIRNRDKMLATTDIDEANAIDKGGEYYVDRYSDSLRAYVIVRRERNRG